MKPSFTLSLSFFLLSFAFASCNDDDATPEPTPFVLTDHYVAGTLTPKSNTYSSVYLISFLQNNKAVFIGSGNNLTGDYRLTKDSLIVEISDPNNYRIARFGINENHELTSAYYRALTMEYGATGTLVPIAATNQLAGKTFKGEEMKMGPTSFRKDLLYRFNVAGTSYGSGVDPATINPDANSFELINNSTFKYKQGSTTELGFVVDQKLTVFRQSGLFYFGTYTQQ